jgi:two-component system response regulator PilR (NtrC family)
MSRNQVLIVDDEPDIRELLELTLGRMNLETRSAQNVEEAHHLLDQFKFDLCLTDMRLPDGNGIDLVRHIQTKHPQMPVAVITAHGSMEAAITALKAGAFDFVSKPLDINDLRNIVRSALKVGQSPAATRAETARAGAQKLLGVSPAIEKVRTLIDKLARGQAPVYIHGESGTGKELVARLIHELGPRASAPFVPVNCGAIPEALMESEFFGHKRGSFTGAVTDKDGLFKAADGGTLFLDEVGDLPLHMQVKLLRAIQEKSVRPVGSQSEIKVDVRILSATHKDLQSLVHEGKFRQDLFYRLNVIELHVPSLHERPEDIPVLAGHLCAKLAATLDMPVPSLTPDALATLTRYDFPGNVRELENILERAMTLCDGSEITTGDLQLPISRGAPVTGATAGDSSLNPSGDENLDEYLARVEEVAIRDALTRSGQNKTAAAKLLGITFRALRYKLEKLGID